MGARYPLLFLVGLFLVSGSLLGRDRVVLSGLALNYVNKKRVVEAELEGKTIPWERVLENTLTIVDENNRNLGPNEKLILYLNDLQVPGAAVEFLEGKYGSKL